MGRGSVPMQDHEVMDLQICGQLSRIAISCNSSELPGFEDLSDIKPFKSGIKVRCIEG